MDWIQELSALVLKYWGSTGKALLLARIPSLLSNQGVDVEAALQNRRLKDAILFDGADVVRIVRDPKSPLAWGLIPANVEVPSDVGELFDRKSDTDPRVESTIRFARGIWLAFTKPLRPGYRRFLEVGPPARFVDVVEGQMPPPNGQEIEENLIYLTGQDLLPDDDREAEIERRIRAWAEEKGVLPERLKSYRKADEGNSSHGDEVLVMDFSGLTREEKSRILIPLDLVQKIVRVK